MIIKKIFKFIINLITTIPKYFITGLIYILNKEKRKEINLNKSLIPTTITILSLITYLIAIFLLTRWYVQTERIKKFSETLKEQTIIITKEEENIIKNENTTENYQDIKENTTNTPPQYHSPDLSYLNINFNYYTNKNPQTVAWIKVNGTNINYPVVKHENNEYYLNHDFYKNSSTTGWIFADYRNNFTNLSNNTIIYGHNLTNRTMFGSLPLLLKNDWYKTETNRYIKISTPQYNSIWQVFSLYKIEPTTDYLRTKFNSTNDYQEFLNKLKNRSIYNFDINLTFEDKIITLSTCDDTGTKRVVMHAKLYNLENK